MRRWSLVTARFEVGEGGEVTAEQEKREVGFRGFDLIEEELRSGFSGDWMLLMGLKKVKVEGGSLVGLGFGNLEK